MYIQFKPPNFIELIRTLKFFISYEYKPNLVKNIFTN